MSTTFSPATATLRSRRRAVGLPGGQRALLRRHSQATQPPTYPTSRSLERLTMEQYALCANAREICERFGSSAGDQRARHLGGLGSRWRITPPQPIVVITQQLNGSRELRAMQWGLVPSCEPHTRRAARRACAPGHNAPTHLLWRNAFHRRRCLVPATAFFPQPGAGLDRVPTPIHRLDNQLFAFAGIWEEWYAPSGACLRSCAILTTAANSTVAPYSGQMPVILTPEAEALWLEAAQDEQVLRSVLHPFPEGELEVCPVPAEYHRPEATSRLPELLTRVSAD